MQKPHYSWTRSTKILHGLLALAVLFQVTLILFRESVDRHGSWALYRQTAILWHKWGGLIVFMLVLAFFVSKFYRERGRAFRQFYPVTPSAWRKIKEDLACLLQGKLPVRLAPEKLGGLAGLIQGLGLLLVLGLSGLGVLAMLSWYGLGVPASWGGPLIQTHKFFAGLIWWYLGGHVGRAVIHLILPRRFQREI